MQTVILLLLKALSGISVFLKLPNEKIHLSLGYRFFFQKEFETAKFYLLRAKQTECPDLYYTLSLIFSAERDMLSHGEFLMKAARAGHIEAAAELGFMLKENRNLSESIEWLSYAAAQGHGDAGRELRQILHTEVMH